VEDTVSILRGLKEKYELHHGVRILDSALVAAATLSNRYITDRFLPDKAIDLWTRRPRVCACRWIPSLKNSTNRPPDHPAEDRARSAEEGNRLGLQGPAGKARKELTELEQKSAELTARWQAEKDKLADANTISRNSWTRRARSLNRPSARVTSPKPASLPMARSRPREESWPSRRSGDGSNAGDGRGGRHAGS
jgi:ATP-dependent Clp protease ATP-binding subunit ClpB